MVGLGRKLGEGRAGAPGDQALLHRDGLCKRGIGKTWKSGRKRRKYLGKAAENSKKDLEKRQTFINFAFNLIISNKLCY